jgi:hypothetical protein
LAATPSAVLDSELEKRMENFVQIRRDNEVLLSPALRFQANSLQFGEFYSAF